MTEGKIELKQEEKTFNNLTLMTYSYIDPQPIGICFVGHGLAFLSYLRYMQLFLIHNVYILGVCEYVEGQMPNINALAKAHYHVFSMDLPGLYFDSVAS